MAVLTDETLKRAFAFAEGGDKGTTIDKVNRVITYVCDKHVTVSMLMDDEMLGDWFVKNGFKVAFERRDVEYITKGTYDSHSCTSYRGHKAYLRDRIVMTITW